MVIQRTPRPAPSLLLAWLLLAGPLACTSIDGPTSDVDEWKSDWKRRAGSVAQGAARGAEAVGESLGTAYRGVRDGFEDPEAGAWGPYPKRYAAAIRRHMQRFEDVPDDASFAFREPERGYINAGILAGGGIEWQGWLVDVEVGTTTFAGQTRSRAFVVRMRDGEVVEVHDAAHAAALRRLEPQPAAFAE